MCTGQNERKIMGAHKQKERWKWKLLALNKESEKESVKVCLLYQILISTYSVSGFYFPDKMIMTQTHSDKQK